MNDEEYVMILRKPVTLGKGEDGITYDVLKLREPIATELDKGQREPNPVAQNITLIALVAGIPRRAAEQLCQRDFMEASAYLGGFQPDGPATGQTPSLN